MKKWIRYLISMLGIVLLILGLGKPVKTEDMLPTIPKWSWVWMTERPLQIGQTVLIRNPLDHNQLLFRRIIALEQDKIAFENDNFRIDGKKITQVDMYLWDDQSRVFKESIYLNHIATEWGIIQSNQNSHWQMPKTVVPKNHVFVACDNRFKCLDSRWWGPIPIDIIEGQVRYQLSTGWNENISFLQEFE